MVVVGLEDVVCVVGGGCAPLVSYRPLAHAGLNLPTSLRAYVVIFARRWPALGDERAFNQATA